MQQSQDQQGKQERSETNAHKEITLELIADSGVPVHEAEGRIAKGDSSMFCTACGTKNTTDANYCKQCGRRVERTSPLKISEEAFAEAGSADEQVRAYLIRAYHRYESGDLSGAVESCTKAVGVQRDSTDAHSLLSTLYEKQGQPEKAIAEREIVLRLNPGSIADREKLEHLRDDKLVITPRKITSSRGSTGSILDSRAGAAIVAVSVTLFVMVAGLAAVLYVRSKPNTVQAQSPGGFASSSAPHPAGVPGVGARQSSTQSSAGLGGPQVSSVAQPRTNIQTAVSGGASALMNTRASRTFPSNENNDPIRQVPPATVQIPIGNGDRRQGGFQQQDTAANRIANTGNTVHLPDNGLSQSELGPPPGSTQNAQNPAAPAAPPRDRGKIEIIVSNDNAGGKGSPGTGNTNRGNSNNNNSGASMDSRSVKRIAQDYQLKGQYKLAISNYIKALDGAADDAGPIHYQIGLCYQRLDERDSAISQYSAAIAAYKEMVSAGKNADAANRGIRAAEAGIKACQ